MINIAKIRSNFPNVNKLIYLDHAAVAPIHTRTRCEVDKYMDHFLDYGFRDYTVWAEKVEKIRADFAGFIGAEPEEIAYIKNTSAGLSILANGIEFKEGDNIVVPDVEFPSNIYPWLNLERKGVNVKFLKADDGYIDIQRLESLIDHNTRIVSISWVEFTNGFRNDLKAISRICQEKSERYGRKIYFCVDAIQGLGALKLDVNEIEIDFMAADCHKWFLALEGAGILYCNKKILKEIHPASVGWKSVKNYLDFTNIHFDLEDSAKKFEEGTLNVLGILSIGASLDLFNEYGIENIEKRVLDLNKYAADLLQNKDVEIVSYLDDAYRSGILSFKTQNIDEDFLRFLSNDIQLSKRGDVLRISPHFYNTEEELEKFTSLIR